METREFGQPLLRLGTFVRGVVIEDEMQGPIRGRLRIHEFEKLQPFLMTMPVLALPPGHWVKMRASNMIERVNQELKRRTRVIRVFPNIAWLLRLITARLCEISDSWESGKVYLNMHTESQFLVA